MAGEVRKLSRLVDWFFDEKRWPAVTSSNARDTNEAEQVTFGIIAGHAFKRPIEVREIVVIIGLLVVCLVAVA